MSAITNLYAGVPVADLDAGIDGYTRLFGRHPDMRAGDEILSDLDEHAPLFIDFNAEHAGADRVSLGVAGLHVLLERLAHGMDPQPLEIYCTGVRHTTVPDPDGNAIAFAELPDAA